MLQSWANFNTSTPQITVPSSFLSHKKEFPFEIVISVICIHQHMD